MFYRQLRKGVNDGNYKLIPAEKSVYDFVKPSPFQDYYTSLYKYTEEQYKTFQETLKIKGVDNVVTDWLVFDFDSKENLELARQDAIAICNKLADFGIEDEALCISFSGGKGFHVQVNLNQDITVEEFKAITKQLANGLDTFDKRINDHARPFRALGSINLNTSLYKIDLSPAQLINSSIQEIKELAKKPNRFDYFDKPKISLPAGMEALKQFKQEYKPQVKTIETTDIDWKIRPKNFTNCRWSLYNGAFGQGDRNNALLCLAATFKNQGDNEDICYRRLKGVAETQSVRNEEERYSDSELYNNIVKIVYNESWKGGIFTCRKKDNWLHDYCESLGDHKCNHKEEDDLKPKKLSDIKDAFKHYVVNIEKNTILTGIPSLDAQIFLSTGCNVGIIGAPGSGKTSLALDIVNNTSKAGVRSVLASLDMHANRLFEKALYRVSGLDRKELYKIFQENREKEIMDKLEEEFGNVNFFHKSCPTVSELREYIAACNEENPDNKIKLVMVDYFERITSDLSDDTAASKRVAGELQDLVNDLDICLVTLVQPNKMALSGGPDTPIMSYTNIKGSSYVYQAFRIIISLWRPFYNPKDFSEDHYMQMAILKNDLGELCELDFGWNGKRGLIYEIEDVAKDNLHRMINEKQAKKNESTGGF